MNTAPSIHTFEFSLKSQEDLKAAIRNLSRLEAECDVMISRLQDELREAKRTGSPSTVIEMHSANIQKISARRESHRKNQANYLGLERLKN